MSVGLQNDPVILQLKASVTFWLSAWASFSDSARDDLRVLWTEQYRIWRDPLNSGRSLWPVVRGPMNCLTAQLLNLQWAPLKPDHWINYDALGAIHHYFDPGVAASYHSVFVAAVESARTKFYDMISKK